MAVAVGIVVAVVLLSLGFAIGRRARVAVAVRDYYLKGYCVCGHSETIHAARGCSGPREPWTPNTPRGSCPCRGFVQQGPA